MPTTESNSTLHPATEHGTTTHVPSPVQTEPGILVHPAADRQMAVEHWLACAHWDGPEEAHREWQEHGAALLSLGTLFSAVRIPGFMVTALAHGWTDPAEVDPWLARTLEGGPVISDWRFRRYYALVPASMPATWKAQFDAWGVDDVDVLGRDTYLGVPSPAATEYNPRRYDGYWAVPMASAAELCAPLVVARFIAAGVHRVRELGEATCD
jgi:hypothetical protein